MPDPEVLRAALSVAVPLQISELERCGGPGPSELAEAREVGQLLAEKGDVLMFKSPKGETAKVFGRVARAIAVLAFCPGGVQVFGDRYEGHADA
jgi:hypothetical protein